MSGRLIVLVLVVAAFGILTTLALMDVGYFGILEPLFRTWGGAQVFTDFVIVSVLACVWMSHDAPERQMPAWPFILITMAAGSFGPLLYLLVRELRSTAGRAVSRVARADS